jgi:mRNA-degrading endonuclease toxin of MazEF toxin-antitoxin module
MEGLENKSKEEIEKTVLEQFVFWIKKKIRIHVDKRNIYFREGQVWWVSFGKNIGSEINGHKDEFSRPALILKKYGSLCFVVPITTKIKEPPVWYQVSISGGNKERAVNITQGRTISSKRFLRKDCTITQDELDYIRLKFIEQFK